MIDGHGDDLYRYSGKIHINFSTNIPQNVCHDRLLEHLHECGAVFRNYPEPEPKSIEQHLASIYDLPQESIIVTNGATEAIYLLAHLFEGKKIGDNSADIQGVSGCRRRFYPYDILSPFHE